GSLECADSAFAEDHARVVVAQYVFRSVKELLYGAHEAAFQKYWFVGFAHSVEQCKILHIPRADLQHVRVLGHQRDLFRSRDFRYYCKARHVPGLRQELQAFFSHALEAVRGGPGLESASSESGCPCFFHRQGRLDQLVFAFNRAGTGYDDDLLAPNMGPVDGEDGVFFLEVPTGKLEWPQQRDHAFDAFQALGGTTINSAVVSDNP